MLCNAYVLGGEICIFGKIGDHGDQYLGFPYFGVWGVLGLGLVTFYSTTIVTGFWGFLFVRKIEFRQR